MAQDYANNRAYASNTGDIGALVRPAEIHADIYLSQELFALEQERLFPRVWQYVGHESQVPNPGDFFTTDIVGQPLMMIRQTDDSVIVMFNRCAHKGSSLLAQRHGNTGKALRCPYHAWTYKLDGSLMGMPLRAEYEHTSIKDCAASRGLVRPATANYRGFIFVRLADEGEAFESYAGEMLKVLDALVDRSPQGELSVIGGCLRSLIHCNWKIYLENVNDGVHALSTHESVIMAASSVWKEQPDQSSTPVTVEQLLAFGANLNFVRDMGARVLPNGHSILGTKASLHSGYKDMGDYQEALANTHGAAKAQEILAFSPQNAIIFPSLALKCSPQILRVVRPLAADLTLIEAWALAPEGAPEVLPLRALNYNRVVYSPMSAVAHDDIHVFESIQRSLRARGNRWISLHRLHSEDETAPSDNLATSEILMRNQFRAWAQYMTQETIGGKDA